MARMIRRMDTCLTALLLLCGRPPPWRCRPAATIVYRCPGRRCSTPTTRSTPQEAKEQGLHARSKARRSRWSRRPSPRAGTPAPRRRRRAPADAQGRPGEQRARDSDARRILEAELQARRSPAGRAAEGVQQRRARAPRRRAQLPEVPRPRRRAEGRHRAQGERHRGAAGANCPSCRRPSSASQERTGACPPRPATRCAAFDLLATLVAVVAPTAVCLFANASFENALGLSRRALLRDLAARLVRRARRRCARRWPRWPPTTSPAAASRRQLRRPAGGHAELLPVHVIVNQTDDAGQVAGRDGRDRAADAPGPRGARARPGAGQQGADPQPGARDQEPARRHPRRGAVAGDGDRSRAS